MAIRKIIGTELEYGLSVDIRYRGELADACADLIKAYVDACDPRAPKMRSHTAWLANGSKFYVDHSHPELATVECVDPMQATLYDHAGRLILARAANAMNGALGFKAVTPLRNNIDTVGNSYGYHQNVLTTRGATPNVMVRYVVPYLVTRQIWQGSGWVSGDEQAPFHVSQRGHLFEALQSTSTTALDRCGTPVTSRMPMSIFAGPR